MGTTRRLQLVPLFADDDENQARAQDELYFRQMGRGSRGTHRRTAAVPVCATRAKLFGGIADGCTVELSILSSEIFVYVDVDGRAHPADPQLAAHERGWTGSTLYRLVNSAGPDEPTYVAPTA